VSYDVHCHRRRLLAARPASRGCDGRVAHLPPGSARRQRRRTSTVFEYEDGLIHEHSGLALPDGRPRRVSCTIYGQKGHGVLNYMDKAPLPRASPEAAGPSTWWDLYRAGAVRNIASFYEDVIAGRCENPTVRRAVNGCLTCILGREAAARRTRLTMDELLRENRRIEVDLTG